MTTTDTPVEQQPPRPLDRMVHVRLARSTHGLSPESIVAAYADWFVHLASAPGKQQELVQKAVRKWARLAMYAAQAATTGCEPCIEPLPQDRRFVAPEWQRWPFNAVYQSFLFGQQWWHNATTDVRGATRHHTDVATFVTRQ